MRSKPKTVLRVNYNLLTKATYILRSEKCLDSVSNSYLKIYELNGNLSPAQRQGRDFAGS